MDKSITFTTSKATYTVVTKQEKRVTRFENGNPIWETYSVYKIFLGTEDTFAWCYEEDRIEDTINWYEMKEANPGFEAHMSSRFD